MREATESITATNLGIKNIPSEKELKAMKTLAEKVFEPLRKWYGFPIRINSFYRSPRLNQAIGGSLNSQHCKGEAMDISCKESNILFHWIKANLDFDQLIWEFGNDINPQWVHVSYIEGRNRKQVLKAKKVKGKTIYESL
jgi:hypothetical protein